jgi:hypothetical protein
MTAAEFVTGFIKSPAFNAGFINNTGLEKAFITSIQWCNAVADYAAIAAQ